MADPCVIDVEGLEKVFRSKILRRPTRALHGLDLTVGSGEVFGFLGPNGAGKTTTIKILLGLIRPSGGRGQVLSRPFGSAEARRDLGFLPDAPNFYRYLSAREFLRFTARLHGLGKAEREGRIDETLEQVGLAGEARDRRMKTYSRGMLQRVGIAAATLHRPRLLVLDEPLNGLDPLGRHDFRDLILSHKKRGTTVFLSSHVLADIEKVADRVAIIGNGSLLQCGTLEEILEGDGRTVEIAFELAGGSHLEEISRRMQNVRRGGRGWIGEADDPDEAGRIVQSVLRLGGRLLGYQRRRISLEEFFVRRVGGKPSPASRVATRAGAGSEAPVPRESPAGAPEETIS